jgi:multimeric flavodoxin WrbA/protein-tyrosine-phosphatase
MVGLQVLGLQGSPRKKGSSDYLLTAFMQAVSDLGADVQVLDIPRMKIKPCIGCGHCEKKGLCVIDDDEMAASVYDALRNAEVVVAASPVFFYSVTAQLKAMIDRSQTFWSRKYRFKLADPLATTRKGFFLSMGGSRGKNLFTCVQLVTNYFFDAIQAAPSGSLAYPGIETRDDFRTLPKLQTDIDVAAKNLLSSLLKRQRLLVLGENNNIRSQIAAALIQYHAGTRFEVLSAGSEPSQGIPPEVVSSMAEIGLDLAFRKPASIQSVRTFSPHHILSMSPDIQIPGDLQGQTWVWDLPNPHSDKNIPILALRKQISAKIDEFLKMVSLKS